MLWSSFIHCAEFSVSSFYLKSYSSDLGYLLYYLFPSYLIFSLSAYIFYNCYLSHIFHLHIFSQLWENFLIIFQSFTYWFPKTIVLSSFFLWESFSGFMGSVHLFSLKIIQCVCVGRVFRFVNFLPTFSVSSKFLFKCPCCFWLLCLGFSSNVWWSFAVYSYRKVLNS
jgi:hypothetical protein